MSSRQVFLSCVTRELGAFRQPLKAQLAEHGVELRIQEDFVDSASPFGTLVKIYRYLQDADLVVQVIGAQPPARVARTEYEELLRTVPEFRDWLARHAVLPAAEAGELGYTDFEAYLALHLDMPIVFTRLGSGAQPAHEARLEQIGRYVESRVGRCEEIAGRIAEAFADVAKVDRPARRAAARRRRLRERVGLSAFALAAAALVLLLQTRATAGEAFAAQPGAALLDGLPAFLVLAMLFVGLHYVAMLDRLDAALRLRVSLRNGFRVLLAAAVAGWLFAGLDTLLAATSYNAVVLVAAAAFFGISQVIANAWLRGWHDSPARIGGLAAASTAGWIAFLAAYAWLGWPPLDALYWFVLLVAMVWLGFATRDETERLEREIDYAMRPAWPDGEPRTNAFYWMPRHEILRGLRADDFLSGPPRR
ncbi:hypothetical protein [Tahibacter caeni]|uniref:hypothetical protein n=1 Tax=Tahibacter caeni TaxID=1453545 RepID=UPI00214877B9|nr:hypothetical protein [Tahibacter caeni]